MKKFKKRHVSSEPSSEVNKSHFAQSPPVLATIFVQINIDNSRRHLHHWNLHKRYRLGMNSEVRTAYYVQLCRTMHSFYVNSSYFFVALTVIKTNKERSCQPRLAAGCPAGHPDYL